MLNIVDCFLDVKVLELVPLGAEAGGGGLQQSIYEEVEVADEVQGRGVRVLSNVEHQIPYLGTFLLLVRLVNRLGGGEPRIPQRL